MATKKSKTGKKARLLEKGAMLLAKHKREPPPLICILCGEVLPKGGMLSHQAEIHGHRKVVPSPPKSPVKPQWVSIVGGGLPSLGKRRR
jgi:hypothetical protein